MSADSPDKEAAKRLLSEVLDSFEKLEIVAHVYRTGFAVIPAPADMAKAISVPVDEVEKCMRALRSAGVFDPQGKWRDAIDTLMTMYEDDRIEVLNLMTRTALERVRQEAARVFADAFVIRPKKKGDPDA